MTENVIQPLEWVVHKYAVHPNFATASVRLFTILSGALVCEHVLSEPSHLEPSS